MLLSLRKNGLTSLFKEVRVFKETVGNYLENSSKPPFSTPSPPRQGLETQILWTENFVDVSISPNHRTKANGRL